MFVLEEFSLLNFPQDILEIKEKDRIRPHTKEMER